MVETALNAAKDDNPNAILPDPSLLQRRANRARQSTRPNHPTSLDFDLDEGYLPEDFLRADINGAACHLVFATDDQLKWLSRAEHWYIDGTFKVVRDPFVQLFSLHAFVRRDACEKQVPLAFIVMSRRTAPDYTAALQAVIDALPSPPLCKDYHHRLREGHLERLSRGPSWGEDERLRFSLGPSGGALLRGSWTSHLLQGQGRPPTRPAAETTRPALPPPLRDTSSLQPLGGCGPGPRRCPTSGPFRVRPYELAGVQRVVSWGLVCLQSACED